LNPRDVFDAYAISSRAPSAKLGDSSTHKYSVFRPSYAISSRAPSARLGDSSMHMGFFGRVSRVSPYFSVLRPRIPTGRAVWCGA
jgi:hypothetical protein